MTKLHELTGQITNKEIRKVYDKKSPYRGNITHKLTVLDQNQEKSIFVYPNVVNSSILQIIKQSQYIDKKYLFFCEKKSKRLVLHDWRELPSKILETHEQKK